MEQLIALVDFALPRDNVVLATGEPWRRGGAISMGGPWSAQSADLHYVWRCKKLVAKLPDMGHMTVRDTGLFQSTLATGDLIALQQFHDNLMVAAKGPIPHSTMYTVCHAMESVWDLKALCPCRNNNPELVCYSAYMSSTVRCMCVSICVSPACSLAPAHPNALDDV